MITMMLQPKIMHIEHRHIPATDAVTGRLYCETCGKKLNYGLHKYCLLYTSDAADEN